MLVAPSALPVHTNIFNPGALGPAIAHISVLSVNKITPYYMEAMMNKWYPIGEQKKR